MKIYAMQYTRYHTINSITQISLNNTFHSLRYAHFRYVKCLFTNTQKQ